MQLGMDVFRVQYLGGWGSSIGIGREPRRLDIGTMNKFARAWEQGGEKWNE